MTGAVTPRPPNEQALQRTRPSRPSCKRKPLWAGSPAERDWVVQRLFPTVRAKPSDGAMNIEFVVSSNQKGEST